MRKGFINILLIFAMAVVSILVSAFYVKYEANRTRLNLGAAQTLLTDTIGTFRTNYNTLALEVSSSTIHTVSISISNPTSTIHASGTITFGIPILATLLNVECYSSQAGTSTIQIDRRASSTPLTAGTDLLSSSLVCGSSAGTTAFATATLTTNSILNLTIVSSTGSPSSTNVRIIFKNQ